MKNTPRDFFLHFGAFTALYFAVVALVTLLFTLIDYVIPDEALTYYPERYSDAIQFSIASLIILVPLFLWLMRVIQRETRQDPERQRLGVRRWLTYVTLFIAGATIIGDLIVLLDSFLGGTLVTTFVLKAAVLFAVMGAGFWYFLLDVQGHWRENERASKLVGYAIFGVVVLSIVTGFYIMGNPMVQRERELDEAQIRDLSVIQDEVVRYWRVNGRLPESLEILESDVTGFYVPESPEGRIPYRYELSGESAFELCASFEQESDEQSSRGYSTYGLRGDVRWEHGAGHICFVRVIDPSLVAPEPRF